MTSLLRGESSESTGTITARLGLTANSVISEPSRLRHISARASGSSFAGVSKVSAPVGPTSVQLAPEGDVYIINSVGVKGGLSLTYTPDNKLLMVGERSGDIGVYRTGKPDEVLRLTLRVAVEGRGRQRDGSVWGGKAIAATCLRPWRTDPPQTAILAGYADGMIRLWDVRHASILSGVSEGRQCLGLAVSPDNRHFVSLGDDGGVYLYDAETWTLISKMEHSGYSDVADGHKSRTFSGVFHPQDMHGLVTGGWDNLLQFWDIRVGQSVRYAGETHIGGSESLDISADGREVLSCSWRNTDQLQTWDYGTAKLRRTINPDRMQSYLYAGRYLTDTLFCCGGSSSNLFRLVHAKQNVTVGSVSGMAHGIYSIAVGPIGARYHPNPALNKGRNLLPQSKNKCPRVAFCSDNNVVELEVY